MSQSKKTWNASKALKRTADAIKKTIKVKNLETKETIKRTIKGRA
jgi:hypothetical protein